MLCPVTMTGVWMDEDEHPQPLNHMTFLEKNCMTIPSTTRVACNPSTQSWPCNHPSASPTRRGHLKVHVPFRSPFSMWVKLTYKQSLPKATKTTQFEKFPGYVSLHPRELSQYFFKHRRSSLQSHFQGDSWYRVAKVSVETYSLDVWLAATKILSTNRCDFR